MPYPAKSRQWWMGWVIATIFIGTFWALFTLAKLPSPALFGALLGSMVYAIWGHFPTLALPKASYRGAQALIGTVMGALVDLPTLSVVGKHWYLILTVCVATIVLSLVAGRILAMLPGISPATGAFAMIAGGASGVTAIAGELGADEQVVSIVQYLRVTIIVASTPIITSFVFHPSPTGSYAGHSFTAQPWQIVVFLLVSMLGGLSLSHLLPFAASSLLWPMLLSAGFSISGVFGEVGVPTPISTLGYLLIGTQVGLRFTRKSMSSIGKALPLATGLIIVLGIGCALIGIFLPYFTRTSQLTAYLGTTPGGLWAVLVIAADSGADITFVLAVQTIRLLLVLICLPILAGYFRRHPCQSKG